MCDERERLLDYLYDACDADERHAVERHLQVCSDCRVEVSELRAVRLDLLAWEVPEHGSVWRPFAPARLKPWYREVPVWALAAAASLTFLLGLGGGLVSQSLVPATRTVAASAPPAAVLTPQLTVSPNNAAMAAMERRILDTVQARVDQQLKPIAAHVQAIGARSDRDVLLQEMRRMVATSEQRQRQALNASILNWLQDSQQTFVTNREFNAFRREELGPSVRSALVAYQRKQQ
jgi:anti-sigma factor RsiW